MSGPHPTPHMPRVQFGIPPPISTPSGPGSNPSSRGGCQECIKKRQRGHRNAREPKYCLRHQCTFKDASGEICINRKKAAESHCPTHATCKVCSCNDPKSLDERGILNEYCFNHTCVVMSCDEGKAHDPVRGVYNDLCATHLSKVCNVPACLQWQVENGSYCAQHTCVLEYCHMKNLGETGRPFCVEHNKCTIMRCQNPRHQFGSQFEPVCRDHYVPPCSIESCTQRSLSGARFCDIHSCLYRRCDKEARPGRGKPFCVDHKCTDQDCQALRNFSENNSSLKINVFCLDHECRQKECVKHNVPDKPFCNSHCCTDPDCLTSRDLDPRFGTFCYSHYEERRIAERMAEIRLKEEEQAANARADEIRRQTREQEHQRQAAADAARRSEARRPQSSPRQRYGGREGLSADYGHPLNNGYEDEGYRSNRSSGGSFWTNDGW